MPVVHAHGPCPWSVVVPMVYARSPCQWSVVCGLWSVVCGLWSVVRGLWVMPMVHSTRYSCSYPRLTLVPVRRLLPIVNRRALISSKIEEPERGRLGSGHSGDIKRLSNHYRRRHTRRSVTTGGMYVTSGRSAEGEGSRILNGCDWRRR
jgi:hypothetical protein